MNDTLSNAEKVTHAVLSEAGPSGKPLVLQSGAELVDSAFGEGSSHVLVAGTGEWVKALSEGHLPKGKKPGHCR